MKWLTPKIAKGNAYSIRPIVESAFIKLILGYKVLGIRYWVSGIRYRVSGMYYKVILILVFCRYRRFFGVAA
jgi:hypothetical protein